MKSPARLGLPVTRQEQLGIGNTTYTYDGGSTAYLGELTQVALYRGGINWANIYYQYEARHLVNKERRVFSVDYLASASGDQTITRSYNALRQPRVASFCDGNPTCAFTGF